MGLNNKQQDKAIKRVALLENKLNQLIKKSVDESKEYTIPEILSSLMRCTIKINDADILKEYK